MRYVFYSFFILVLLFTGGCSVEIASQPSGTYCSNSGRDTWVQFGKECRFALLAGYEDHEIGHYTNQIADMYDQKKNQPVASPIYAYEQTNSYIYMVSKNEYLRFDVKENVLHRHISLSSLPKKQQKHFNELTKVKATVIQKAKSEKTS